MAHRRIKNIDFEDENDYGDEYDDYDAGVAAGTGAGGDDGLTDDDREQLRNGTIRVREQLGDHEAISEAAIQEALYHYWYDVDKAVIYLKNENRPAEKKQQKAVSKFDQAASASAKKADSLLTNGELNLVPSDSLPVADSWQSPAGKRLQPVEGDGDPGHVDMLVTRPFSPKDAFAGLDWSPLATSMQTTFTATDRRPRLHLLGGSGKPSKLAALAAARKAKDTAKKNDTTTESSTNGTEQSLNALSLLDRLGGKDKTVTPKVRPNTLLARKRQAAVEIPGPSSPPPAADPDTQSTALAAVPPMPSLDARLDEPEHASPQPRTPQERSAPSVAAMELCQTSPFGDPQTSPLWQSSMALALFGNTIDHISQHGFSALSPDGMILQAQAKGNVTTKKTTKQSADDAIKIAAGVDDLTIDDAPRERPRVAAKIQSKNLDVAAEYQNNPGKRELNVVIAGHVDHGKSTLMGRLLLECSLVDQRTLDKYRKEAAKIGKESFALAWVMDAREDEREHGITIDYSEKVFETDNAIITIIDAPGHRDYVGNMIAGTSMADCALLVVDAGTNSFLAGLKGQTKEHAQVIRAMKLEKLVVAVNKMDAVAWSQSRFEEVCAQATSFLEDCLFDASNIVFVPCSGLSGDNVSRPLSSSDTAWYGGPTLVRALENLVPDRTKYLRPVTSPFRMRITGLAGLSEFSEFVSNNAAHEPFTVSGRIEAGNVQVGDTVISLPIGEEAVVKGLTRHGKTVEWAVAGQLVGLQLSNCDEERFNRGDLVCGSRRPAKTTVAVTMKILAFNTVFPMPVEVHRGRMRAAGRITELVARVDRKDHNILREGPKLIRAGEVARVSVEFDEPVALERPSRVVLRYGGETIAAGAVEGAK